jgi:hypothetical protein
MIKKVSKKAIPMSINAKDLVGSDPDNNPPRRIKGNANVAVIIMSKNPK